MRTSHILNDTNKSKFHACKYLADYIKGMLPAIPFAISYFLMPYLKI